MSPVTLPLLAGGSKHIEEVEHGIRHLSQPHFCVAHSAADGVHLALLRWLLHGPLRTAPLQPLLLLRVLLRVLLRWLVCRCCRLKLPIRVRQHCVLLLLLRLLRLLLRLLLPPKLLLLPFALLLREAH